MSEHWNEMYRGPVQETGPRPHQVAASGANVWAGSPSVVEAVKWVLASPDWMLNTLLAYVFAIIPIVGQMALSGWSAEIAQRLVRGQPNSLPKLDFADFGQYMSRGIPGFLVRLVYGFAAALIWVPVMVCGVVGFIAFIDGHQKVLAFTVLGACILVIGVLVMFVNIVSFAADWRVELTEQFGEGMKVGAVFSFIRRVLGPMLGGFLLVAVGGMVIIFIPLVGPIAIIGVLGPAMVHYRWQLYSHYLNNGGEPIAVKAPVPLVSEARLQQGFYPRP